MQTLHLRYTLSLFISGLLGLFVCCKSNDESVQQEEILAIEKEVLKIHDDVMPKMSDIARLLESLGKESQNTGLDSVLRQDIEKAMTALGTGDSLMWEWMHNYAKPEDAPLDSIKIYLLAEKDRITKVRDVMLEGISNAESIAQKLGHVQPN